MTEVEADVVMKDANSSPAYPWKYITDEFIESPNTLKNNILSQLTNNKIFIDDVFYEILITVSEYSGRISHAILLQFLSEIIANYKNVEIRAQHSEKFIILASSFKMNKNLSSFIKDCSIDTRFKIMHLDKSILRSESIFLDYGKYQYNDARTRIFSVDSFSSLHEASEGYSKFIIHLFTYFDIQSNDFYNVPTLITVLNRIIAEFNLDNNRCFLLELNILSNYLDSNRDLVLEILKQSPWWNESKHNYSVQTIIVDYLLNYVGIECKELKLITLLIQHNIVDFDSIYNSLGPYDFSIVDSTSLTPIENNEIEELYQATKNDILAKSKISNASALALAAPLLPDSDDEDETSNSTSEKHKDSNNKVEVPKKVSILEKAKLFRKLNMLEYLIEFEMIDKILLVLVQYPQIPLISDSLTDKLNHLLDKVISSFYFSFVGDDLNITSKENEFKSKVDSIDEFLSIVNKFITFVKYKIARNSSLLTKIVRIMNKSLEINLKTPEFWLQFYRLYIFPSLSFTNNIPVVTEAFDVFVKYYPLDTRYNIYGEYQLNVKNNELTKLNYDTTEKKTRDLLKRLSIENVNVICRSLNKLCSVNPLATTNAFISHIESYNSLIDLVCESSKFFNKFSWDVITFQLLNKLNSNRLVIQQDGLNYSQWFVNLSQFIGKLSHAYPESFQLSPILTNIIKSLISGDSNILLVVKELLDSMTGIKSITNLTTKQIMRMNAETSLRKFAYMSIEDNRENCMKSCNKLINSMVDNKLFSEIFILLCHVSINLIDKANNKPLKFVNQKCDEVSSLLHILTTAIDSNLSVERFKENMISPLELITTYKIQPQWAFEIWRRTWAREIKANDNKVSVIFAPFRDQLKEKMFKIDWNLFSIDFYLTFWQLSLYDINFDDLSYMMEYSDLRSQITGINMKLRTQKHDLNNNERRSLEDKSDLLMSILPTIKEDMQIHENNFKLVMERLENEKNEWFINGVEDNKSEEQLNKISLIFLESCVLPRLQHSSFDAVYVSKFIFFINKLKAPGYSLKSILNNLFMKNILPITLFINTTMETENLALFYQLILGKLQEWWDKTELYETESFKFGENLEHTEYRKLLFKWHESLLNQILKSLGSESYTTRNNAILFLKVILSNFPTVEEIAEPLLVKLEDISNNDERDDIKLASRALIGLLKFKENKLISVWEFYEMEEESKNKAMQVKEEKVKAEKERQEAIEKKRLEEERKEREKNTIVSAPKPYGLVGLGLSKKEKVVVNKPEEKNSKVNDSEKMDVANPNEGSKIIPSERIEVAKAPVKSEGKTEVKSETKNEIKTEVQTELKPATISNIVNKMTATKPISHSPTPTKPEGSPLTSTPATMKPTETNKRPSTSNETKKTDISNLPKSPSLLRQPTGPQSTVRAPTAPTSSSSSSSSSVSTSTSTSTAIKHGINNRATTTPSSKDSITSSNNPGLSDRNETIGKTTASNNKNNGESYDGSKRVGGYRNNSSSQRYYDDKNIKNGNNLIGSSASNSAGNKNNVSRTYYNSQHQQQHLQYQDRGQYLFHNNSNSTGNGSGYYNKSNHNSNNNNNNNNNNNRQGGYNNNHHANRQGRQQGSAAPLPPPPTPPPNGNRNGNSNSNNDNKRRNAGGTDYGNGNYYKRSRRQ